MTKQPELDGDFAVWFRRIWPAALRAASRVLGSGPAAEDAAAEAFGRALASWSRVCALPHRDAWVLRVAINVAIDHARRGATPGSDRGDHADHADAVVARVVVGDALSRLPKRQREVVSMHHLGGLGDREIADTLGISTNSVKKHYQRGMHHLRGLFAEPAREVSVAV